MAGVASGSLESDARTFGMSALPDCHRRRRVRVWRYATGALRRSYDESLEAAQELQRSDSPLFSLDPVETICKIQLISRQVFLGKTHNRARCHSAEIVESACTGFPSPLLLLPSANHA